MHVAVTCTGAWQAQAASLEATLSADERARIERLRFRRDRDALVTAYGVHRLMLAQTLGVPAAAVPLYRDAMGRPRVRNDAVWTSLSHAAGWVALAIDTRMPVGIDIEPVWRASAVADVIDSVLHPEESAQLVGCEGPSLARELLALWVRKEAVLKAAGVGLRVPMCSFKAPYSAPVRIPGFDQNWQVRRIQVDAAVEMALAVSGHPPTTCAVIGPSSTRDAGIAYTSRS